MGGLKSFDWNLSRLIVERETGRDVGKMTWHQFRCWMATIRRLRAAESRDNRAYSFFLQKRAKFLDKVRL